MSNGSHSGEGRFGGATQSWAHHADLVMYARRVLGDRSDTAEDVVQEAYLRLLGLAASDQAPTSARPWLFRVVRNLAIDERRSAARRADPVADTAILGTAAMDDTAGLVEQREELADAFREIAALPPRERQALEMDQAGIGAQEIASELGTTPNAVHQALFRARRRLRESRAVAWGLIPIGMVPLLLKLSDPALATTLTNLPPGAPVGRALPVAGIVAALAVGGGVVAPNIDGSRTGSDGVQFAVPVITSSDDDTPSPNRGPSVKPASTDDNSGPGVNSGPGNADDDDDDESASQNRNRNRNRGSSGDGDGDDEPESGKRRNRGSGKAPATGGGDDDGPEASDSRKGRGSGSATPKPPSADDSPDAPDEPDAPDAPDDNSVEESGSGND